MALNNCTHYPRKLCGRGQKTNGAREKPTAFARAPIAEAAEGRALVTARIVLAMATDVSTHVLSSTIRRGHYSRSPEACAKPKYTQNSMS